MSESELSQEEMHQILREEVDAYVEFGQKQMKEICERGPPLPGRKTDPASRYFSYLQDTLPAEMMYIFDPDYLQKVREGVLPPPQQDIFYLGMNGESMMFPLATPDEVVMLAQQMGVPPDPMTGQPPIIQKQNFWWKLFLLPKDTEWTAFGFFAKDFKNLHEEYGRQLEKRQGMMP